jgi:hypothetical protein
MCKLVQVLKIDHVAMIMKTKGNLSKFAQVYKSITCNLYLLTSIGRVILSVHNRRELYIRDWNNNSFARQDRSMFVFQCFSLNSLIIEN